MWTALGKHSENNVDSIKNIIRKLLGNYKMITKKLLGKGLEIIMEMSRKSLGHLCGHYLESIWKVFGKYFGHDSELIRTVLRNLLGKL